MSSFRIQNTVAAAAANLVTNNVVVVKTYPEYVQGGAIVSHPISCYRYNIPITYNESSHNVESGCHLLHLPLAGNYKVTWTLNVTVPSATEENPKHLNAYLTNYFRCDDNYYNYAYNIFKITSDKPTTYEFTNFIQNTWGDLDVYFGIDDPHGCYPEMTVNGGEMAIVSVKSMKADGGQAMMSNCC